MPKTYTLRTATGTSQIRVGVRLSELAQRLPADRTVIVTDSNVQRLYARAFPPAAVIPVGLGEGIKTLESVSKIYAALIATEADRSFFVVGIGGGVVCDITGFAASTYLRGVRFGFVPTTLLAQVDAAVGGKNGVNFGGYKNMVGVFAQPEFVYCDPRLLTSLPAAEVQCGLAEIVKHGAIADDRLFGFLEQNTARLLELDPAAVERTVCDSVRIKAGIVEGDEREAGERRKLNFGHTFGHAIEKASGVPHGAAVSAGMVLAADLSVRRGLLAPADARRLVRLLQRLGLPTRIRVDRTTLSDALRRDKKRRRTAIHFVLLKSIGKAVVTEIPIEELETMVYHNGD